MKNIKLLMFAILSVIVMASCGDDDEDPMVDFSGTYSLADQMGRPAINTVFVPSDMKDAFNETLPRNQAATYQPIFENGLKALSPAFANAGDQNALGQDAAAFTGLLASDVLNVSLDGTTTFYDGTNVLTGRALADDVITVELLLIFGGEDFMENPTLSDDNVDSNDKEFLTSFPYLAAPF